MDRPKRAITRISNYRKYHLLGDLEEVVQGKVTQTVEHIESLAEMSHKEVSDTSEEESTQQLKSTLEA